MKLKLFFLLLIVSLFGFVPAARAFEVRGGESITVPAGTVVKGSLLAGGNTVTIDGTVDGDLYCAGQTITVSGTVTGDVLCAGQTLDISGFVGGNVRSTGQLLNISGNVKRNVVLMGQTMTITPEAVIAGEVLSAGQTLTVDGRVGREMVAAGQTVRINSAVAGNVTTYVESLSLGEKARIIGDLTYTSPAEFNQATGAAIVGKVSHLLPKKEAVKPPAKQTFAWKGKPWPQNVVGPLVFYLVVGLLVVLIAPKKTERVKDQMLARPWFDGLIGFLIIVLAPTVLILFAITIIGIPVALLLGAVLAVMTVLARIWAGVVIGDKLLAAFGQKKAALLAQMAVGVVVVELFVKVPILGFFVSLAVLFWGLGGAVMTLGKR